MRKHKDKAVEPPLYQAMPKTLFRAPLLPVEQYFSLAQKAGEHNRGDSEKPQTPDILRAIHHDPRIRLALIVGSRSAYEGWERGATGSGVDARLRGKLLRYLIRMSTRPTPYGLFSGVALATFGTKTDLAIAPSPPCRRTRPDMGWLLKFAARLEARPEVRRHLKMFTNSTAQVRAGRVMLADKVPRKEEEPTAEVSVRATAVVRKVLALAQHGIPYRELLGHIVESTGAAEPKVEKLLSELWEQTILLTDLVPSSTTLDPARRLAERLGPIDAAQKESLALSDILTRLSAWDDLGPEPAADTLRGLADAAATVIDEKTDTPFQTDLKLPLQGQQIHSRVGEEVARAAELLLQQCPLPDGPPSLAAYRAAFVSRYNEGREVPLLELLDPGTGLGPYGSISSSAAVTAQQARRSGVLLDLACRALRTRTRVVELNDQLLRDLRTCSPSPATAPPTLDIYAQVAATSSEAIDEGDFTVVIGPNIGAIGGGRNLGRFAYLMAGEAVTALKFAAEADDALTPDVITAELVYQPRKNRLVNVTVRPGIRTYEIHYGAFTHETWVTVIPLGELTVGVRQGRFYLRWGGKDVRVTSGHVLNTLLAPDVCRFLTDIGQDKRVQLSGFGWGPAEGFPYLPRVQSGRVVLRPAEWRIQSPMLHVDFPSKGLDQFGDDLARWREVWDVPRFIFLSYADNRLALDLEDAAQVEELFHEVRQAKKRGTFLHFQEVIPSFQQAWVDGPGGHYYSEFVVSLMLAPRPSTSRGERSSPPPTSSPRAEKPQTSVPKQLSLRPPGSDWLYLKLYGGQPLFDQLIAGPIREFCEYVLAEGFATRWFFLRYLDPDPHIRLRFSGAPIALTSRLFPALCDWATQLLANGYCNRFSFDTYDREVERYGGEQGIELAESVFFADSVAVASYKALTGQGSGTSESENLTVLTVDNLLAGLGLSESDRLAWLRDRVTWRAEVGPEYRLRRTVLRETLGNVGRQPLNQEESPLYSALRSAREALGGSGKLLASFALESKLTQANANLLTSFVHMHCNRMLGVDPGAEKIVLGLLQRTRESLREAPFP